MAKKRMFDTTIIESDSFCQLSKSAQTLYFHLNMLADDDGIVDMWKSLLRYLVVKRVHLDSLIDAGYIIELDSGALLISDWLLHNTIRRDRYNESRYKNDLSTVQILANGRYFKGKRALFGNQDQIR